MPQNDIAAQWKSFDPDRRNRLLGQMTDDQKASLRTRLQAAGTTDAPPDKAQPLDDLAYHPPGTDATPAGTFGDKYIRPIANAERALIRKPGEMLNSAIDAVKRIPQDVRDFAHPVQALQRGIGLTGTPIGTPLPEGTTTTRPAAPSVNYDEGLPNLIGGAAAQYLMGEGIARLPSVAATLRTPGGLRERAQGLVGAGKKQLAESVQKTANAADDAAVSRIASNKKATESTLMKRGKVEDANTALVADDGTANFEIHKKNVAQVKADVAATRQTALRNRKTVQAHRDAVDATNAENTKVFQQHQERARVQGELDRASQELDEKMATTKSNAKDANDSAWNTWRAKVANHEADMTSVRDAIKNQENNVPVQDVGEFRKILRDTAPGEADMNELQFTQQQMMNGTFGGVDYADATPAQKATIKTMTDRLGLGEDTEGVAKSIPASRLHGIKSSLEYAIPKAKGTIQHALGQVLDAVRVKEGEVSAAAGAQAELDAARKLHGPFVDTFVNSPNTPATVASSWQKAVTPEFAAAKLQAEKAAAMGHYDPTIPSLAGHIENLRGAVSKLPEPIPRNEIGKPLPPKPKLEDPPKAKLETAMTGPVQFKQNVEPDPHLPVVQPEVNLTQVRTQLIEKMTAKWRDTSQYQIRRLAASGISGLISGVLGHGALEGMSVGYLAAEYAPKGLAALVDKPSVMEWLTKPSAEDIRAIRSIPTIDRVKVISGLKDELVIEAQRGRAIKLTADLVDLLGTHNVGLIAAASTKVPQSPEEAKKRAQELREGKK